MNNLAGKALKTLVNEGFVSTVRKSRNYINRYNYSKKFKYIYGDILIINGCTLPHPQRYRVDHQVEQLRAYGLHAERVNYEELNLELEKYYRGFIFFRCPITPVVEEFINKAKSDNKQVFFDIDDLVIDKKYTKTIKYLDTMSKEERALYDDGVERTKKTLKMCDYAITTTTRLAKELNSYVKDVYINRNVASEEMVMYSQEALKIKEKHEDIIIGYLSGSITHNPDVELVKPILIKLMKKYKNLKIELVGEITIPDEFKEFEDRIIVKPFISWQELPKLISNIDINIAPLEDSIFNEAKSENKWLEAALVKTVTVASNIGAFAEQINDGIDGFLCSNEKEWEKVLVKLIEDEKYRCKVANNAYDRVIKNNITTYTGHGLSKFIKSKLNKNIAFVLPTTNISGGVNVITRHISMLKKYGNDVFIINMDDNNDNIYTRWGEINVLKKYKTKYYGHFDVMVATLWTTVEFINSYNNVKNRLYLVQNFETDFQPFGQYARIIANATYEDNNNLKYVTISKWCQNWLKDKYEKKSKYAPNGIDLEQFRFKKRDFKGKIKILIEGNSDDYYKNVDESFNIVEKLNKDRYEIHFLSYQGEPKKWYYVDKFMHKIPYSEVGKVYQDADILIKSSILESFSYPPLEMMATGGLVVVAPNGGNVEYLKDNENCLMYEPGNIEDAVKKIDMLSTDIKLRNKLIEGGKTTVKKRAWENIEKDIVDLYED